MHNLQALLLLAPIAAKVAVADPDYDFDRDEVPPPCRDICQPMVELTNRCDDFDFPGDDRTEDRLERQCVCTNDSFDVPRVAALCASCFEQNRDWRGNDVEDDDFDDDDDDDDDDVDEDDWEPKYIRRIMRDCGFSSVSYSASAHSTVASTISVSASRFTETAQLTTTIDPARSTGDSNDDGNSGGGGGGNNDGGNNDGDDDADRNNDDGDGNGNNDGDDDDAAASLGLSLFAVVGAAVAGGFMLA